MKTVLFYSGRRPRSPDRGISDRADCETRSRARLAALFRRANILAILGAAVCISFFVLCTAQSDHTPTGIEVPGAIGDPDAVAAVMASVDERPGTASNADRAVADEGAATDATDAADTPDTSVWSRLEALLRRLIRRES